MLNKKKIKADLCVVGGGMSGICAAIASFKRYAQGDLGYVQDVFRRRRKRLA